MRSRKLIDLLLDRWWELLRFIATLCSLVSLLCFPWRVYVFRVQGCLDGSFFSQDDLGIGRRGLLRCFPWGLGPLHGRLFLDQICDRKEIFFFGREKLQFFFFFLSQLEFPLKLNVQIGVLCLLFCFGLVRPLAKTPLQLLKSYYFESVNARLRRRFGNFDGRKGVRLVQRSNNLLFLLVFDALESKVLTSFLHVPLNLLIVIVILRIHVVPSVPFAESPVDWLLKCRPRNFLLPQVLIDGW